MASEAIELVEQAREVAHAISQYNPEEAFTGKLLIQLADTIERLMAECEKLVGWQPIETAPKDGTRVLLHGHRGDQTDIGSWGPHGRYIRAEKTFERAWGEGSAQYNPIHWKPLPEPLSQLGGDA